MKRSRDQEKRDEEMKRSRDEEKKRRKEKRSRDEEMEMKDERLSSMSILMYSSLNPLDFDKERATKMNFLEVASSWVD